MCEHDNAAAGAAMSERRSTGRHGFVGRERRRPHVLPLSERRRDLERLCQKGRVPFLQLIEAFPGGGALSHNLPRKAIVADQFDVSRR